MTPQWNPADDAAWERAKDVEPNFKTTVGECGCGDHTCTAYGTYKRPWPDGSLCVKSCKCKRCNASRFTRRGHKQQARGMTRLGVPTSSLRPGNEENVTGALRMEVKATRAEASVVLTAFDRMRAQSETARPIGDNRPFVGVCMSPSGADKGVLLMDLDDVSEVVAALVEQLGMLP